MASRLNEATATSYPALQGLTYGEVAVLRLMARGMSNSGIAAQLFVSPRTIEGRLCGIYTKFDLGEDASRNRRVSAVLRYLSSQ